MDAFHLTTQPRQRAQEWVDPHKRTGPRWTVETKSWGSAPSSSLATMIRLSESEKLDRPYAQSGIVYSCVQARAGLISAAPPVLWLSEDEDAEKAKASDPHAKLLRRPNPLMGRIKFWRAVSSQFDLAGGTFIFMTSGEVGADGEPQPIRPGQLPVALWPIREDLVQIEPDGKGYSFQATNSKRTTFPIHAVAHLYDTDPDNPLRGLGPMQAAWRTANNLFKAQSFDDALTENGGQIGGIVAPKDGAVMDATAKKVLKDSLSRKGKPKQAGEWAIVPAGLDFKPAAFSPVDMQAKDLRILGRNEVLMIFKLTPPLLGIVEDVNRANGKEARRVFYESSGIPFLDFLADEWNAQLAPLIGSSLVLGFDWQSIPAMREDSDATQRRVRGWMECGRSFREAATIEQMDVDLDGMEGVDERYLASALVPVEIAHTPAPEPVLPDEPKALTTRDATRSRARRIEAIAEVEKRLQPRDRAITRGIARVFKAYVSATLERARTVAESVTPARSVTTWDYFPDYMASWSPETRALAEGLDLLPDRKWLTVRGISQDELEQLLVRVDDRWRTQLWHAAEGPLRKTVEEAAHALAQEIEAVVQVDAASPAMVRLLAGKEILLKEGPMSIVAEQVKRTILEAMADAPSAGALADRVRATLETLTDDLEALSDRLGTRAAMIARTETASVSNAARLEQLKAAGIVQHEWASAGDEIVREAHQIDGEVTIVGEPFSNGLTQPGQPGAPAALVVNCRCAALAVIPSMVTNQ